MIPVFSGDSCPVYDSFFQEIQVLLKFDGNERVMHHRMRFCSNALRVEI